MGKGKRNRNRGRDRLEAANADVRAAEEALMRARRRAAIAADASPAQQAEEFFNRPGDYYVAQFEIRGPDGGAFEEGLDEPIRAETVLKADAQQLPYLVEVMRQIRGGFGERARISLTRAKAQQQRVVARGTPAARPDIDAMHARAEETRRRARREVNHRVVVPDGEPQIPGVDMHLGLWDLEGAAFDRLIPEDMRPDEFPTPDNRLEQRREYTREELQAQLPGMTRAEVADELGVDPADIGGDIKGADTIEVEQLAAELGLSPLDLIPIDMRGGGRVYAVKPRQTQPPAGRHTRPGDDPGDNKAGDP